MAREINLFDCHKRTIIFCLISIIFFFVGVLKKPELNGDGYEYLGMSVAIKNHFTPNLLESDITERHNIAHYGVNVKNRPDAIYDSIEYSNYTKSLDGKYYGLHFWLYSGLSTIFLPVFQFLKMNPLKIFQFTNCLLLTLMFWWLLYKTKLSDKLKYYLTAVTFISPIWFYVGWSHPEVFTFVFLYIGLLEFVEKRKITACLFGAIASLQNPAAILFPFFVLLTDLISKRKIDKELFFSGLASLIGLFPYLFYYVHFHKFSLITGIASSLEFISLSKILDLFFDLNFGLIVYIPVLLLILFYSCIRKNKTAVISFLLLTCIAIVDATQFNWNSDMNLLNRYSFWMIPIVLFGSLDFIDSLDSLKIKKIVIAYLVSTGFWLLSALDSGRPSFLTFCPIAKVVFSISPALYNPEPEVFVERTLHSETAFLDILPISYYSEHTKRKTLVIDSKTGKFKYINEKTRLKIEPIKIKFNDEIIFITKHGIVRKIKG